MIRRDAGRQGLASDYSRVFAEFLFGTTRSTILDTDRTGMSVSSLTGHRLFEIAVVTRKSSVADACQFTLESLPAVVVQS